jgi:hypothetical protein
VQQPAQTVVAIYGLSLRAGLLFSGRSTIVWREIQGAVRVMAVVVITKPTTKNLRGLRFFTIPWMR